MTLEGIFRRRRLPHWDVADATYFVTSCLAGSIPAHGLGALRDYRDELEGRKRPGNLSEEQWEEQKHKLVFAMLDRIIDNDPVHRWLEDFAAAQAVVDSFYHFAGERYHLLAYVVMPSHVHWVFHPTAEWSERSIVEDGNRTPRERILHSVKSFTGNKCNRILGRSGAFWQDESYEHCVRGDDELLRIIEYIEQNPVKAGLVNNAQKWPFSSAVDRVRLGVAVGERLVQKAGVEGT